MMTIEVKHMRDTIDMAREAGLAPICEGCDVPDVSYAYESWDEEIKAFEALVRADERSIEREACAKFFDLNDTNLFWGSQAAKYIRARGETK